MKSLIRHMLLSHIHRKTPAIDCRLHQGPPWCSPQWRCVDVCFVLLRSGNGFSLNSPPAIPRSELGSKTFGERIHSGARQGS